MHELRKLNIATMWEGLEWTSSRLTLTNGKIEPLEAEHAPREPGLYRITWDGVDDWRNLPEHIKVMASPKITDTLLSIRQLQPPVLLTIGRTTNIDHRIRQHLGTNKNNNRLFMRLKRLLPHLTDENILATALRSLQVEWVEIPNWRHRCLLEHYGSAVCMPLFDIDAEH